VLRKSLNHILIAISIFNYATKFNIYGDKILYQSIPSKILIFSQNFQ
jgi:hypothetical protein